VLQCSGALKGLPVQAYEYAEWKKVGVNIDYHVSFNDHFYSVAGVRFEAFPTDIPLRR
jgi:hypothetical protein